MILTKNNCLTSIYLKHWDHLKQELVGTQTSLKPFAQPWLIDKIPGYEECKVKVLIVGKETNGWYHFEELLDGEKEEIIPRLQQKYLQFRAENKWAHTPFWKGANLIHKTLNPDSPDFHFMTTNLIKVDQNAKRPQQEYEEIICTSFPVLKEEISYLNPDVVIFFTGPYYDDRIKKTFQDVQFKEIVNFKKRHFSQLQHQSLPLHTYRTYHPGFSMRNRRKYFDPVLEVLKQLT